MRKSFILIAAAVISLAAASCKKEMAPLAENLIKVSFKADFQPADKAGLTDGKTIGWEASDSIAVWDGTAARVFHAASVDGSSATFFGEIEEGATEFYVVSPFAAFKSVAEGVLTVSVPASQKAIADGIDPAALVQTAYTDDLTTGVSFKNAISLVKFTIDREGISRIQLSGNAAEKICGNATTDATGETITGAGSASLSVAPESGEFENGTYYAAIVPTSFESGVKVFFSGSSVAGLLSTASAIEFPRNGGRNLGAVASNAKTVSVPNPIMTTEQLMAFNELAALYPAGGTVKLGADISLEGEEWTPVTEFKGTLDGQGFAITKIQIETSSHANFITNLYGTVKNLKFGAEDDGSYIRTSAIEGTTLTLAPIGVVYDGGQLTDIENHLTVETTAEAILSPYVGGICGRYNSKKTMSGCKNYGLITYYGVPSTTIDLGGLIGTIGAVTTIENCENHGEVIYNGGTPSTTMNQGGIAAYCSSSATLKNCSNSGKLSIASTTSSVGSTYRLGGIIGLNQGNPAAFNGCTNSGELISNASGFNKKAFYAGGILGQLDSKSTTGVSMTDCTNSGNVTNATTNDAGETAIGGMIGKHGYSTASAIASLTGCTNTGALLDNSTRTSSTATYMGGMIGYNQMGATLKNCTNGKAGETCGTVTRSAKYSSYANYAAISAMIGWQTSTADYSKLPVTLTGCHNYATILCTEDASSVNYFYMGSMIAANEPIKVDGTEQFYTVTIDDCTNDGAITNRTEGRTQIRMGGFIGDGANIFTIKNSTNNGAVSSDGTVGLATIQYRLGGLVGSISKGTNGKHIIQNSTNTGNIVSKCTNMKVDNVEFGGILGFNSKKVAISGCTATCDISYEGSATTKLVRGIIGRNGVASSSIKNCKIAGNMDGTVLTAENFSDYIWGTTKSPAPSITLEGNTFWAE